MNVPFVDLKAQYRRVKAEMDAAIASIIENTAFIGGAALKQFEANFATATSASHCIGVGNGTDALFIALKCLGVGAGDEVLVPATSFVATSEAVTMAGGRPVFVDIRPDDYTMDVDAAAALVTPKTKAIIPVHLYGMPADMPAVRRLADAHGLKIVQDCAQSHLATLEGQPLMAFGDVCCYSFYPGKNLGAYGDGGAICLNDDALAQRMRMFANHGRKDKYDHEFEGVNSRLDGLQAAVLGVKLPHLETWTEERRAAAARYTELLQGIPSMVLPRTHESRRHVYHLYVVQVENRAEVQAKLKEQGVATGVHFPIALPFLGAYAGHGHAPEDFPHAYALSQRALSLPMFPELSEEQIQHVAACLRSALA